MAAVFPVYSRLVHYADWKDRDDVGTWFRDSIIEMGKAQFLRQGALAPMVNALGILPKASARVGRAKPQLVQHAIDISALSGSHEERDIVAATMPELLREIRAFYVVTAAECWAVFGRDADLNEWYQDHESLGEHPRRQEALSFLWERTGECGLVMFPILREDDRLGLGEDSAPEGLPTGATGRYTHWLSDPPKGLN